jgi:hypothetical protein
VLLLPAAALLAALSLGGVASARDETVAPFQDHRIVIGVPEKYGFESSRSANGLLTVRINDPQHRIDLVVSFFPDTNGRLADGDGQRGFVADASRQYAEGSVEMNYDFKNLKPRTGSGLYCVFTDASLVRKLPLPPGEYLKVTSGVKAWSGCFLLFTLLSDNTTSEEYQTALRLVQESFEEMNPTGKPSA